MADWIRRSASAPARKRLYMSVFADVTLNGRVVILGEKLPEGMA